MCKYQSIRKQNREKRGKEIKGKDIWEEKDTEVDTGAKAAPRNTEAREATMLPGSL
jgi:hypothetical protein